MPFARRAATFTVAALCLTSTASADVFTREQLIKVNKEIMILRPSPSPRQNNCRLNSKALWKKLRSQLERIYPRFWMPPCPPESCSTKPPLLWGATFG